MQHEKVARTSSIKEKEQKIARYANRRNLCGCTARHPPWPRTLFPVIRLNCSWDMHCRMQSARGKSQWPSFDSSSKPVNISFLDIHKNPQYCVRNWFLCIAWTTKEFRCCHRLLRRLWCSLRLLPGEYHGSRGLVVIGSWLKLFTSEDAHITLHIEPCPPSPSTSISAATGTSTSLGSVNLTSLGMFLPMICPRFDEHVFFQNVTIFGYTWLKMRLVLS